jgi:hypothetical protein
MADEIKDCDSDVPITDRRKKKSRLSDPTGKPSDIRLKSWIMFALAILQGLIIMLMFWMAKDKPTLDQYQVPFALFCIFLVGGICFQLMGKLLETWAGKRLQ